MIFKLGASGFEDFVREHRPAEVELLIEHSCHILSGGIDTSRCQNLKSKGRICFLHLESTSSSLIVCESSWLRAAKFL